MHPSLAYVFGFSQSVKRKPYVQIGVGLMLVKYVAEATAYRIFFGHFLLPWEFLNPTMHYKMPTTADGDLGLNYAIGLAIWSLPFLWIGISMSVRRAADAGYSPWAGLMFLVPGLNFIMMATLSLAPSSANAEWDAAKEPDAFPIRLKSALSAIGVAVVFSLAMGALCIFGFGKYGGTLFFLTPVIAGAAAAYLLNREEPSSVSTSVGVACISMFIVGGATLIFAMEGVICLLMAAPIALGAAAVGALIGRSIALHWHGTKSRKFHGALMIVALPGIVWMEPAPTPTFEVTSVVEVNASPETVWKNVVRFPELAPPKELLFRAGVAYPIRARLDGHGVGATRYCEFSTGAFVEPITVWEEARRLAFSVKYQPRPMVEMSPFENVTAPHLDGYFRSVRGEFRLVPLAENRTRLEGSTWYQLEIYPVPYWRVFAEPIVHTIHERVLNHIRAVSEAS